MKFEVTHFMGPRYFWATNFEGTDYKGDLYYDGRYWTANSQSLNVGTCKDKNCFVAIADLIRLAITQPATT